jgi:hypothetical protein
VPEEQLEVGRPHLKDEGYTIESPSTPLYNCFAWAAGDDTRWWEPFDPDWIIPHPGPTFWPPDVPREFSLDNVVRAYISLRYSECDTDELETGFEKVALYTDTEGFPSHAARQLESGAWTSKIGELEDIEHATLRALVDGEYGTVARILRRPRPG